MAVVERGARHGTDVLLRQVDGHLAVVRAELRGADLDLAERLAACLRELVIHTTSSSAVDRAQVRAAVHCFVFHRDRRGPIPHRRSLADTRQVVNRIVRHLNRPDLVVASEQDDDGADPAGDVSSA